MFLHRTVQTQTMVMMNQLLNLLLLLLVFVMNLPSCSSLCDISAARRLAHARGSKCDILGRCRYAEEIAKRAADQADVIFESVFEAYAVTYISSMGTRVYILLI